MTPTTDLCNGADDDCNGTTDDTDPAVGTACDGNGDGCKGGTWSCSGGALGCGSDSKSAGSACDEDGDGCTFGKLTCGGNVMTCAGDAECAAGLACDVGQQKCLCPSGTYDNGGTCVDLREWVLWKVQPDALADANYQDLGDGTVKDVVTGLVWQKGVDSGTYTWSATAAPGSAQAYCETLTLSGGGWRLPTSNELMSLVDYTKALPGPAINAKAFPGTPSLWFWTSTPYAGSSSGAWGVYFDVGSVSNGGVALNGRVRCVR